MRQKSLGTSDLDELAYRCFQGKQLRSVKRQFRLYSGWLWFRQCSAGLGPTFDLSTPALCQVIYSQFGLAIHQNDHQARRRFVEWAQNEIAVVPDFHKQILFSDEAHFWLNGYVNKQNCRIWSEANP
ncbi:hypothetical protein TNCV_3947741 [Trichonephila clavipes]|nr:hypothetical protein TNCV_3947741 [Trichonephila clavipes]